MHKQERFFLRNYLTRSVRQSEHLCVVVPSSVRKGLLHEFLSLAVENSFPVEISKSHIRGL